MKHESLFEKELSRIAPLFSCRYFKIPDPKNINRANRHSVKEDKRPFDAVLVTQKGCFCIECKYKNGSLLPHQKLNGQEIEKINGHFYVFRKIFYKKRGMIYRIENSEKTVLFESNKIEDLLIALGGKRKKIDKLNHETLS